MLMLSARWLGPAYRGEISVLIASAFIMNLLAGLAGGPAVMNRGKDLGYLKVFRALGPWQSGIIILVGIVFYYTKLDTSVHATCLAILIILGQNFQYLLIGHNKIKIYNYGQLMQAGVPLLFLMAGFSICQDGLWLKQILIFGLYAGYALPMLASLAYLPASSDAVVPSLREWFTLGSISQFSNLIQFINYRYIFYLAGILGRPEVLGELTVAIALAESVWIIGRSVSVVGTGQWMEHGSNRVKPGPLSLQTFIISSIVITLLAAIPQEWIQWVIGHKYVHTHAFLMMLAPGIALFSLQFPYSGWFASKANYKPANYAASLGFLGMLIGFYLIPQQPFIYIFIPPTMGYIISTALFMICYHRESKQIS